MEFALGPYGCGKDLDEISAIDFARAAERDIGAFCRQGYGALLAKLAEGMPVQLSTPVTQIDAGSRAPVEMPHRARARSAAATSSSRRRPTCWRAGKIKFDAGLPKRQLDALGKLKLGSFDHIALELPGNPLGLQRDDLVFEKAAGPRTAALLANVAARRWRWSRSAGEFGRELVGQGRQGDGRVRRRMAHRPVRRRRQEGGEAHASDAMERRALGAGRVLGGVARRRSWPRRTLMEPVRDRVFFAGEAVHETLWGTVGGAWDSASAPPKRCCARSAGSRKRSSPSRSRQEPRRRNCDKA